MQHAVHFRGSRQRFERLREMVAQLPEVKTWPEMRTLIDRARHREEISVWEYPVAACLAAGGTEEDSLPGAAAIFCALTAIHLIDDLLDEDPKGDFHHLGVGRVANLASAFQAVAHQLIEKAQASSNPVPELQAQLSRAFLATALGQELDTVEATTEEAYWQRVDAKTPPLFAAAFTLGGLLAGASTPTLAGLERLGRCLGRFVQVSDDLADVLSTPASADWSRPRNNLALHYALTTSYPERNEFAQLALATKHLPSLAAAQKLLFKSGAVSYCLHQMSHFSTEARSQVQDLEGVSPAPLCRIIDRMVRPLEHLLAIGSDEEARGIAERE